MNLDLRCPMQPTGWIRDDDAVDAVTIAMNASHGGSIEVSRASAPAPDGEPLRGFARRQIARGIVGVFPWMSAIRLYGDLLPSWDQARGTCVMQGVGRMAEDAWHDAIVARGEVGRPVRIACEPIYGLGRVQIGQGRLGTGDGLVVGWAIQALHRYGLVARAKYGVIDLTQPNEALAVQWGMPGQGCPPALITAGQSIKIRAFRCLSGEDVADLAWARIPMAYGWTHTYSDKNADGVSRLSLPANHCTEALGGCVSASGEILIGGQQSWRQSGLPRGPNQARYKGGTIRLREGMCLFPLDDADRAIRAGAEWWGIQFERGHGFRPL